jgi:hypothetical protein
MTLLNTTELNSKISSISKMAGTLTKNIQVVAVNAIGYSIEHGDIRIAQRLFDSLPKSVRRQSLITFFEKYGQMYYSTSEKKFVFAKVEGITFDYKALMATAWHEAKAEVLVSEIDVADMFEKFMKRVRSGFEKHNSQGVVIKNAELYDELCLALDRFNASQILASSDTEEA